MSILPFTPPPGSLCRRLFALYAIARLFFFAAGNLTAADPLTTIRFTGTFVDHPSAGRTIFYNYDGGIQSQVNNYGNIPSYTTTVPASSQISWFDPEGAPLQGDGRYADHRRSTGPFVLNAVYYTAPNHLVTVPVGTVHFTNGIADDAWLGGGQSGMIAATGRWAAAKLTSLDERRMKTAGDPVQLGTGAAVASRRLFTFHGARDWEFRISYNSALAAAQDVPGAIGFGWSHPFEAKVVSSGANRIVQWGPTHSNSFSPQTNDPSSFVSADEGTQYDRLTTLTGGGWRLLRRDQSSLRFDAAGRLVEDVDPHGRKLVVAYDGSGRIASITEPISNTRLTFTYAYATIRVETITDGTGAVVALAYNSGQVLNRIVNQNGKAVDFLYDANRGLLKTTDHLGAIVSSNTYDGAGRVVLQDDGRADNQKLALGYVEQGLPGSTSYADSDIGRTVPMFLPVPGQVALSSFTGLDGVAVNYTLDSNGRLASATRAGLTTTATYDAAGNLATLVDPNGQVTKVTPGIVVAANDRSGRGTLYRFDAGYRLLSATDAAGGKTEYRYDAHGNVIEIIDPLLRSTRFGYDAQGNVVQVTDPAGLVSRYEYDARNNLAAATDSLGHRTSWTYDALNNPVSSTDATGGTIRWTYDANSLPLTITLPGGGQYRLTYTLGRLAEIVDPAGVSSRFGYDADGRVSFVEDAAGNRTRYGFDPIGNLVEVTDPRGGVTRIAYDHRNRRTRLEEPTGAASTYDYDEDGNLDAVTDGLGQVTRYVRDGEGRVESIEDPSGRKVNLAYDVAGRTCGLTNGEGETIRITFNAAGEETAMVDPSGAVTSVDRDDRGLPSALRSATGEIQTFLRDALGRSIGLRDATGLEATWHRDALGRVVDAIDPGGLTASTRFDADGNPTALVNPLLAQTDLLHDAAGKLTGLRTPEGRGFSIGYDARGLVRERILPSGERTTVQRDQNGRVASQADSLGTITYERDLAGRIVAIGEADRVAHYAYDAAGRMTDFTDGDGNHIAYAYDEAGRLLRLTYQDGKTVSYDYDRAGRLTKVTDWDERVTKYVYDSKGQVVELLRPNGTREQLSYDATGHILGIADLQPDGSTPLFSGTYAYDLGGKLTRVDEAPVVETISPPLLQTCDRDNRLLSHNGSPAVVDADGDLRSITVNSTLNEFSYDVRRRLIQAGNLRYTYDAENRRIAVDDVGATSRFVVDRRITPDRVLTRLNPDGSRTNYVYGLGLLYECSGAELRYYHFDRRGDTRALTDATGKVTGRLSYGPYGEPASRQGADGVLFQFCGQHGVQTDPNGLTYHRARYYHPLLRRFLSEDSMLGSVTSPLGLNRFAYTRGDPVSTIDPRGLYDEDVHHDLTYSLAVRAGFSREAAETIAASDQDVDDYWRSSPYYLPKARELFHFTTTERREEMLKDALESGDLSKFGWYLHAEQDHYAHQRGETAPDGEPYSPLFGHVIPGPVVDRTAARPELAVAMAEDTYRRLREFYEATTGNISCDDWANIAPVIAHFVRIER
ncbi:MAG TPA: RHS repeat-associated core domain-containing protein [Opitutaceae bacterium]|nr:RHS repeat-associated core domain-containing protein [Opitutaceae bacterium]